MKFSSTFNRLRKLDLQFKSYPHFFTSCGRNDWYLRRKDTNVACMPLVSVLVVENFSEVGGIEYILLVLIATGFKVDPF